MVGYLFLFFFSGVGGIPRSARSTEYVLQLHKLTGRYLWTRWVTDEAETGALFSLHTS